MKKVYLYRNFLLATAVVLVTAAWCVGEIQVEMNGRPMSFNVPPTQVGGRTMVPLRGIFEALGAEVRWDGATRTIYATKGSTNVQLSIGDPRAIVNGRTVMLDTPALILRGATMVPLRFVSEALGADVAWMAATQTVSITMGEPPTTRTKEETPPPQPPSPATGAPSVLQGTVQSLAGQGGSWTLLLRTEGGDQPLKVTPDAVILSKVVGQQASVVRINDVQPGDEVMVRLDASGKVILLEATHGLQTGKVKIILGNNLLLTDGTLFALSPQAGFLDAGGKPVSPTDIKENTEVSVRYSPQSKIAWQVRMAQQAALEQPKTVVAPEVVQFFHSAQKPLKEGDIIEVTLVGTADCKASFDIGNVVKGIPLVASDKAPGRYTARYVVPKDLNVTEASLFGRLERDGVQSPVVQAATPVTVDTAAPEILAIVPDENTTIENLRPNIAVMYDARGGTPVNEKGVSLSVTGKDVTSASTISPRLIAYSPASDMKPGLVRISVQIPDMAGNVASKTWEFTIRRTDNLIRSVQHSATGPLRAGDVLEVTAEAAAGGKATFSVEGVAKDVPMHPVDGVPGRYVGKFTIGNLPATDKAVVRVDFTDAEGRAFTATAAAPVSIATIGVRTPVFSNLANGDRVRSPLTFMGTTSPNAVVSIRIVYSFNLLGVLPQTGVLTTVEVTADKNGEFKTEPVDLTIPMARRGITYTVTAVARDASGAESEPARLELKSER